MLHVFKYFFWVFLWCKCLLQAVHNFDAQQIDVIDMIYKQAQKVLHPPDSSSQQRKSARRPQWRVLRGTANTTRPHSARPTRPKPARSSSAKCAASSSLPKAKTGNTSRMIAETKVHSASFHPAVIQPRHVKPEDKRPSGMPHCNTRHVDRRTHVHISVLCCRSVCQWDEQAARGRQHTFKTEQYSRIEKDGTVSTRRQHACPGAGQTLAVCTNILPLRYLRICTHFDYASITRRTTSAKLAQLPRASVQTLTIRLARLAWRTKNETALRTFILGIILQSYPYCAVAKREQEIIEERYGLAKCFERTV